MELADLDTRKGSEEGFALELTHPKTGAAIGLTITVLGVDSDAYQAMAREQNRRRVRQMQKMRGRYTLSPEEAESDTIELLAACTKGWTGAFTVDGAAVPYSTENAAKLYRRFPWIREQVDLAIADRANFLPSVWPS